MVQVEGSCHPPQRPGFSFNSGIQPHLGMVVDIWGVEQHMGVLSFSVSIYSKVIIKDFKSCIITKLVML